MGKGRNRNFLHQQFHTDRPNQVWVSDITIFKFSDKYYYLCAIIGLFSRKIISYRISQSSSTQLLTKTFRQAYSERKTETGLMFHSDRGRSIFPIRLCVYWRHLELNNLFPEPGDPMIMLFQKHSFPFLKRRNCIAGITNLK